MTKRAQISLITIYAGLQLKIDGGVYRKI